MAPLHERAPVWGTLEPRQREFVGLIENGNAKVCNHKLLIIDELGFVPLSKAGAELLFELISQRYERGATLTRLAIFSFS